jgi:hypothetical protein
VRRAANGLLARPLDVPEGHKFCRTCQRILPLSDWGVRPHSTDGYHTRCRECDAKAQRSDYLARKYGLTPEDVEEMLAAQGGLCAICEEAEAVHVDHCHDTGRIRGLLCFRCNAALGQFDDVPSRLRKAAEYLERHRRSDAS